MGKIGGEGGRVKWTTYQKVGWSIYQKNRFFGGFLPETGGGGILAPVGARNFLGSDMRFAIAREHS